MSTFSKITLAIGDKNYSSWSLRPWLVLRHANLPFEEIVFPLYESSLEDLTILNKKLPVLYHGNNIVWNSLSICKYINEISPESFLWPQNPNLRSLARSICAEMHASFSAIRTECKMDMRRNEFRQVSKKQMLRHHENM